MRNAVFRADLLAGRVRPSLVSAACSVAPRLCRAALSTAAPLCAPTAASVAADWRRHYKPLTLQPVQPHVPRTVPAHIERPPYARSDWKGDPRSSQSQLRGIEVKDAASIAAMRRAGQFASYIRAYAGALVRPGRSTDELDALVHAEIVRLGIYPSPLGYAGFPKSLCSSVNQAVVHGIPDARKLEEGDIVNLDVSVYVDGHHGDCSATFVAGHADPLAERLLTATRECLDGAISLCKPGVPFNAIGAYIAPKAHKQGFSIVKEFCGHGIGKTFHMPPLVFHCANSISTPMQAGMTFTIEPILNEGGPDIEMLSDGWTYVTCDGSRSAQFEETILITDTGCEILTKHDMPLPENMP